jgi:integrase
MTERYRIKTITFVSGERFPMLVDVQTGIPLFDATSFILSEIRGRHRASATIEQVLRALKVFYLFCDQHEIDLSVRMRSGLLLEIGEIDALVRLCRLPMPNIEALDSMRAAPSPRATASLEAYRIRAKASTEEVSGYSAGMRIRYIRDFVQWLSDRSLTSFGLMDRRREALFNIKETVVSGLTARIPSDRGRNKVARRRALDESTQDRLWSIVDVDSPENPWESRHARIRNALIVRWFVGLGIRRGELLGVRVSDVSFRKLEVFIARRADDPGDPRTNQPNTKTHDRLLPISDDLARRTHQYIVEERRRYASARRHPFLFVANGGAPLSLRGLNEIFMALRKKHPDLPDIFPHLLRHTNNYNFSNLADEQGLSPEVEKKTRAQIMGWSETSSTAETYTRREIERKARAASLHLQNKMTKS